MTGRMRTSSQKCLGAGGTALALILLVAACSSPAATPTPSVSPASSPRVESPEASTEMLSTGAELYVANCQSCHGDQRGRRRRGASPHNEEGHTWHHPDAQLKEWVLNGKPGLGLMPRFKDRLKESEVDMILGFIKTWWTDEQRLTQADISRRYQEALDKQKEGR